MTAVHHSKFVHYEQNKWEAIAVGGVRHAIAYEDGNTVTTLCGYVAPPVYVRSTKGCVWCQRRLRRFLETCPRQPSKAQ